MDETQNSFPCSTVKTCSIYNTMADATREISEKLKLMREFIVAGKDLVSFYTEDAVILPPGGAPVVGIDAVASCLKKMYEDGMADFIYEEPVVRVCGDGITAWSYGLFDLKNKDGKVYFSGKSAAVWKKNQATNDWLLEMEMFNDGR